MNTPSQQPGAENVFTSGRQVPGRLTPEARMRMMKDVDRQLAEDIRKEKERKEIVTFVAENTPTPPEVSVVRGLSPEAKARVMEDVDRELAEEDQRERERAEIAQFVAENTPMPSEVSEISAGCRAQAQDIIEDKRYH